MLRWMDVSRGIKLPNGSCEAVFSSHVLEHLYVDDGKRLIVEIYRVLAPGGVCRTVVPDLQKIVALFDHEKPEPFVAAMYEVTNSRDRKNEHHSGYTGPHLLNLFKAAGFSEAKLLHFKEGKCPDLEVLDNRPEESIFIEAYK
jgi:predicted SAM-dependent methyltransferase